MKRKITEVSIFEFFLCMFVILIHVLSEGVSMFPRWSVLSIVFFTVTRLTTFAVPAFIFTSALKLFYKYSENKFTYFSFLLNRIRKIFIPYVLCVILYYIVFVYIFNYYDFNPVSLIEYILNGDLSAQFYFVVLIMQFYLLMPLWVIITKYNSKLFGVLIAVLAFAATVFFRTYEISADYTHKIFPSYLIFWVLGMYAGLYYNEFIAFLRKYKILLYVGWLILAIAHCVISYMEYAGLITASYSAVIVVLFCLFSTFGFYQYSYGLTMSLESRGKGFLISISAASYDIYLIHCLIITAALEIMNNMNITDTMTRFVVSTAVTYAISIILCVLIATVYRNLKSSMLRGSARRARKKAARKRYL